MRKREPFKPHVRFQEQKSNRNWDSFRWYTRRGVWVELLCTTCVRLLAVGGNMIKCTRSSEAISAHICFRNMVSQPLWRLCDLLCERSSSDWREGIYYTSNVTLLSMSNERTHIYWHSFFLKGAQLYRLQDHSKSNAQFRKTSVI